MSLALLLVASVALASDDVSPDKLLTIAMTPLPPPPASCSSVIDGVAHTDYTWIPESGLRGLYCRGGKAVSLKAIRAASPVPVFRSGPHEWEMNWQAAADFGHYDPRFPAWLREVVVPQLATHLEATQPLWDAEAKKLARTFDAARKEVDRDPDRKKQLLATYQSSIEAGNVPFDFAYETWRPFADAQGAHGYDWYVAVIAPAFWLRRNLDGTADEWAALLDDLFRLYDPTFASPKK